MDNSSTELTVYAWSINIDRLEKIIKSNKYKTLNLLFHHEYQLYFNKETIDFINDNNIKINLVTCSLDQTESKNQCLSLNLKKKLLNCEIWPMFWFLRTHNETFKYNDLYRNLICTGKYEYNFINPFLSFNGRAKFHRSKFIDLLAKEHLLDKGIVTYHQIFLPDNFYDYKYYSGEIRGNVDNYNINHSSYEFTETFVQSFLHIPTETDIDQMLISEKTATPILCKLPFLTLGSMDYHKKLKSIGLELYDEIFDYSFDSEPILENRIERLIENIHFVVKNQHRLNDLYQSIKPKIQRNYDFVWENYMTKYNNLPNLIKNRYDEIIKSDYIGYGDDNELIEISSLFTDLEPKIENKSIKHKELYFGYWDNFSYDKIIKTLDSVNCDRVIIFGHDEWEPWATKEFIDYIELSGIHAVITVCSMPCDYISKCITSHNVRIQNWPTYYFHNMYNMYKHTINASTKNYAKKIKYPFISLNHRGHLHRCYFIDHVIKNNLQTKGIITWHDTFNESKNFSFNWYNGKDKFTLNDDFIKLMDSHVYPIEYEESLFDFVTECTANAIVISEKTIKPIIFKKPFVILGGVGINQFLKHLGFELFDEVIDYSFDNETDLSKRTELFVENMNLLVNNNNKNYSKIYKKLLPKIMHNYNNFFNVIKNDNFPEVVLQQFDKFSANSDDIETNGMITKLKVIKNNIDYLKSKD